MHKKSYARNLWLIIVLCLMCVLPYPDAFASDRDRDRGPGRPHHEVVVVGHQRYHYRDGRFYRLGWFGLEFAVVAPPIGAVVTVLPFGHRAVIAGDVTYYYYDHVYYRACPSGYIVVPVPVANPSVVPALPATQSQTSSGETVTINVPNTDGSFTPVTLVKRGNGYVGPQGEYYPGNPTVEQLKALYGK